MRDWPNVEIPCIGSRPTMSLPFLSERLCFSNIYTGNHGNNLTIKCISKFPTIALQLFPVAFPIFPITSCHLPKLPLPGESSLVPPVPIPFGSRPPSDPRAARTTSAGVPRTTPPSEPSWRAAPAGITRMVPSFFSYVLGGSHTIHTLGPNASNADQSATRIGMGVLWPEHTTENFFWGVKY